MNIEFVRKYGKVYVEVVFEETSNTNRKVDTSFVTQKLIEEGYKPVKYLEVDAIRDKAGSEVRGKWIFKVESAKDYNNKELEFLQNVKGIGKKTSEKLLDRFGDLATLQEEILKGDIDNFSGMSDKAEDRLRKYVRGDNG